jgi:hypothetical protein
MKAIVVVATSRRRTRSGPSPRRRGPEDPTGAIAGLESLDVDTSTTGKLVARIRGVTIAGAADQSVVSVTARIGNDCWAGEQSCAPASGGAALKCRKANRP